MRALSNAIGDDPLGWAGAPADHSGLDHRVKQVAVYGVFKDLDPQARSIRNGYPSSFLLDRPGDQLVLQRAGNGLELEDDIIRRGRGQVQRRRGVDGAAPGVSVEEQ